jgi:hypothetical protein
MNANIPLYDITWGFKCMVLEGKPDVRQPLGGPPIHNNNINVNLQEMDNQDMERMDLDQNYV